MNERVFVNNIKNGYYPVLLRVWYCKGKSKEIAEKCNILEEKGRYMSRLDLHEQFSIPFKEANKHPHIGKRIKIVKEITGTDRASRLLNW